MGYFDDTARLAQGLASSVPTRRYCQLWTKERTLFAWGVATRARIRPRVVLAWMAVESGGDPVAPQGARFNFLQIKGTGSEGSTPGGFAIYGSVNEAVTATVARIRSEPGLKNTRGKSAEQVMRTIASTWDDGPGVSRWDGDEAGYLARLRKSYQCIPDGSVRELAKEIASYPDTVIGEVGDAGVDISDPVDRVAHMISEALKGVMKEAWPLLLKGAVASFGLALVGYGVAQLAGSGRAAEHVKQATSTAGTVGSAAT